MIQRVDVAIIGSGFAGSILAWILARHGVSVALIDSATHPRFAVGESSTPIADVILRRLAESHQLPELESLSTWGSWQQSHPELSCGRKRGFSYFVHTPDHPYGERRVGERSLLVAASESDALADTHWFRADVDQFFFRNAVGAGATDLSGHAVMGYESRGTSSRFDAKYTLDCLGSRRVSVLSDWVIDASGQAGVLARLSAAADRTHELQTRTHSLYAHYAGVGSWSGHLEQCGIDTADDPFNADDAAQHHLLGDGWLWMLRFNNGVTSVGYTAPLSGDLDWSGYPSIEPLFRGATLVGSCGGPQRTQRLQRLIDPVIDERCLMLPTAAATIDPLHSTGIAHALAGVQRLSAIIMGCDGERRAEQTGAYRQCILNEVRLLDQLVSTAYATMGDFPRFTVACMLYFAGAIQCEERYQRGETPTQLWNADDEAFVEFVSWACGRLRDRKAGAFEQQIRERLQPWNTAGLMNPSVGNRYAYTATKRESIGGQGP